MTLAAGSRLGPYEIVAPLGAGGMGEVYRARDPRLNRDVAVKVLPADFLESEERRHRFELEARLLAALNHPAIAAIHSFEEIPGPQDSPARRVLVMELLEGATLRTSLLAGPLPLRKALDVAAQIADGLAAAHEKGIVHRDVKPENVFLTKEGRVKLLDFGLARPHVSRDDLSATRSPTISSLSSPGSVAGTVAYMSPEQASGHPVDFRSDQFSLGIVLYEMLAGLRPFRGDSAAETMAAIIREEPAPLERSAPGTPTPIRFLVERCLSKEPVDRYDSTRDLAREIATWRVHLSEPSLSSPAPGPAPPTASGGRRAAVAAAALLAAAAFFGAGAVFGPRMRGAAKAPDLSFRRLTFRRGWVSEARFAEQGKSVVYSATWGGAPTEFFSIRLPGTDSIPLGVSRGDLLAVSPSGELAFRRNPLSPVAWWIGASFTKMKITLATVPLAGGTPKDVAEAVLHADYAPDGTMAVARNGDKSGIEYPVGSEPMKVQPVGAGFGGFRISRDGRLLAFHGTPSQGSGSLLVLQPDGTDRSLTKYVSPALGLAWSPNGDEVWYAERNKLRAVSLSGRVRDLYSHTTTLRLHDVAPDGRVLMTAEEWRKRFFFRGEGDVSERELSWLDDSILCDLSPDGKLLTFFDQGGNSEGLAVSYRNVSYLRETGGGPPMRIGEGAWPRLSPDGKFVVVIRDFRQIVVYPVGAGAVRTVKVPGYRFVWAGLLSDGQGIWFTGTEEGTKRQGFWVTDLNGSKPRLVTPEGAGYGWPVAPEGLYVAGRWKGGWWLFPLSGGEPRPLQGVQPDELISGFGPDIRSVYVAKRFELPLRIFRVDLRTGRREFVREIDPPDRTGVGVGGVALRVSTDGRSYASGFDSQLSDLYLVEGLR